MAADVRVGELADEGRLEVSEAVHVALYSLDRQLVVDAYARRPRVRSCSYA